MSTEFFDQYKYKIKTKAELLSLVGDFPRTRKLIICHGVFDVVHPGHVRHLAYAKSKADILAVTITADRHITKAMYRPHIPEGLRALNLAAFEMVDYVVIDDNATPLHLLDTIRPDFFAKGFEYTSSGLPPATQEEAQLVEGYGGTMIFTPGDHVFSSSKFLNLSLPKVQLEKLLHLMEVNDVSFDSLREALTKCAGYKAHVIGDTIVDTYTRCVLTGGQTKTPTFSVLYQNHEDYVGGAGIVAMHLRAAGAEVTFSTVLGTDRLKDFVIEKITGAGIKINPVLDNTRPTTQKNAFVAGGYRLLKVDTLDNRSISSEILKQLEQSIAGEEADTVVFSDFRHGIFNNFSIPGLTKAIPAGSFRVADSQVASRWGNISDFKDFDLITPNEREARFVMADQDSIVGRLAGSLVNLARPTNLVLKLGEKGVFCLSTQSRDANSYFSIDSFAENVVDAIGAGDALLAYSTLIFLNTQSLVMAGIVGSMAAACECEIDGNVPIKSEMVLRKIDAVEKSARYNT